MARENNFLLGKGEKLTGIVDIPSGGGPKKPPYEFSKAKTRLNEKLEKTTEVFSRVPAIACPGEEVVALMTLHPRYLSKSDFPQGLLHTVGLRAVGTRPKKIKPESWGIKKHPQEAMAEQVFIAGKKSVFGNWIKKIPEWTEKTMGAYSIVQIEDLVPFQAEDKLRGIPKTAMMRSLKSFYII